MNPTPTASSMLPPQAVASMIRGGGTPGMLFQQNPMEENMTPGAMGYDPTTSSNPEQAMQQMTQTPDPQMGMQQPNAGVPGQNPQEMGEAQMILQALMDRLAHHSKITEKTVSGLSKMLEANQMVGAPPTA